MQRATNSGPLPPTLATSYDIMALYQLPGGEGLVRTTCAYDHPHLISDLTSGLAYLIQIFREGGWLPGLEMYENRKFEFNTLKTPSCGFELIDGILSPTMRSLKKSNAGLLANGRSTHPIVRVRRHRETAKSCQQMWE